MKKNTLSIILIIILVHLVLYYVAVFISLEPNIKNWDLEGRVMFPIMGLIISGFSIGIYYEINNKT
jgi:ABC-type multidrug transport system permease subunit